LRYHLACLPGMPNCRPTPATKANEALHAVLSSVKYPAARKLSSLADGRCGWGRYGNKVKPSRLEIRWQSLVNPSASFNFGGNVAFTASHRGPCLARHFPFASARSTFSFMGCESPDPTESPKIRFPNTIATCGLTFFFPTGSKRKVWTHAFGSSLSGWSCAKRESRCRAIVPLHTLFVDSLLKRTSTFSTPSSL